MNRQLHKFTIQLDILFTVAFVIKALVTGTWQDCLLVAIMMAYTAYRTWIKTKTTSTQAFEKKVTELEAEVNSIKSAIALRRSY